MKRNHIYIGGTVLLAVLGAAGGYLLFAGSEEGNPEPRAKGDASQQQQQQQQTDDDVLPIEVPPMMADDSVTVPIASDVVEPPARYAMNGDIVDSGSAYGSPPLAGGVSALPSAPPGPIGNESQTPLGDSYGLPAGDFAKEPASDSTMAEEYANPIGAAAVDVSSQYRAGDSGLADEAEVITRGQDDAAAAVASELGNSLRNSARAAFAPDEQSDVAQPEPSRYGGAAGFGQADRYSGAPIESASPAVAGTETIEDAVAISGDQSLSGMEGSFDAVEPAPPAPITVADAASPLGGAPTPAQRPLDANYVDGGGNGEEDGASESGGASVSVEAAADAFGEPVQSAIVDAPTQRPLYGETFGNGGFVDRTDSQAAGAQGFQTAADSVVAASGGEGSGRPGEAALEGPQAPQVAVEKIVPDEIQVGKNCTFTIVVRNTGRVDVRGVRLVDEIPLGTQLVSTSPRAAVTGGQVEWDLGTLAPGAEQSVEVELLPTGEGEIGSVATVHFAAAASARTRSTRPRLELTSEVDPSVMIGQQQVVRITLSNPGSGDATGVLLLENVPAGMSHPHGPDLEFEVGTLRAGESRDLELVLSAQQKGVFQNRIAATGDANLRAEDVTQFEVVAPEIAVSVDGPQRKYLELPATFTVAVENSGTAAAKDIELVGKLPPGLEFVSADNYGEYDAATRSVYWSLAELSPRQRGEVKLVALPIDLGEQRLQVQAGADLGLVDRAESTMQVEGLAAIKFEVTDVADPIEVGGETSYEIRVVNQGSKAATNVIVLARFPEGIKPIHADGPTDNPKIGAGQVVFAPLAELSPKADTTYHIDVQGVQPGDQRVFVQILTNELAEPVNEEESTQVYADQ